MTFKCALDSLAQLDRSQINEVLMKDPTLWLEVANYQNQIKNSERTMILKEKHKYYELAEKEGEVVFVAVDVDENAETAEACGITCMPTF